MAQSENYGFNDEVRQEMYEKRCCAGVFFNRKCQQINLKPKVKVKKKAAMVSIK